MDREEVVAQLEKDVGKVVSTKVQHEGERPRDNFMLNVGKYRDVLYEDGSCNEDDGWAFVLYIEENANGKRNYYGIFSSTKKIDYERGVYFMDNRDKKIIIGGRCVNLDILSNDQKRMWEDRNKNG